MKFNFRMDTAIVQSRIKGIAKKLDEPRQFLADVGEILTEDAKNRITTTKSSPSGKKWTPWAASTAEARTKDGSAALGLLLNSGTLLDSIHYSVNSRTSLTIGSTVRYSEYLQEGTESMPARPFLGMSTRSRKAIDQTIKLYLGPIK